MTKVYRAMIQHDAAGGVLLVFAAVLAMILANSTLLPYYDGFLSVPVSVTIDSFEISKPLLLWINDGLMAIFFFLVGLEVKREVFEGSLSSPQQVILPGIAAVAGIAIPALIYYNLNPQGIASNGWAIPSATDIAFALGVFALFSKHLPVSLKLFLLSVAIMDDIGAIIIIALFYSSDLSALSLTVALGGLVVLLLLNRMGVRDVAAYLLVGLVVWAAVLKSGVHATLAGFAIAWFIPLKLNNEYGDPLLKQMEHSIQPWVAFLILPLFAFANAGVSFAGITMKNLFDPVTLGIALGLFVGKQLGIFGSCWLAVKAGIAKLPEGASWREFYGVSLLCGIGFTMSLFIGTLAFENQDVSYMHSVKIGVLLGSLLSAITAVMVLTKSRKPVTSACTRELRPSTSTSSYS